MNIKVLWIDDEYKKQINFIIAAEQKNIDIEPVESTEEGLESVKSDPNRFDAVILDAKGKLSPESGASDLKGMKEALDYFRDSSNNIPYFIFTGQPDYLDNRTFKDLVGEFYKKPEDADKLFKDIEERVKNSLSYQIRNKYQDVFKAFSQNHLDLKTENRLLHLIKGLKKDNLSGSVFNEIRKVMEAIFYDFNKQQLMIEECFPFEEINLTYCVYYFCGKLKINKTYIKTPNGIVAPKDIQHTLHFIKDITNTGSHHNEKSRSTDYLVYSAIYALMNILIWYKNLIDEKRG